MTAVEATSSSEGPEGQKRFGRSKKPAVARPRVTVARERQYRQTVRKVDVWSVLKVSLCFYLCALLVVMIAATVMWTVATRAGFVENAESFMNDLLSSNDFRFLPMKMFQGALLVGLTSVAILTVLTVVGAIFYNLFGEVVGGIEVTVVEEDSTAAR